MNFVDGPPHPGQMSFPFTIQIPVGLPASMVLGKANSEQTLLSIEYMIRA